MTRRLIHFENAEARPTPLILLGELQAIDPDTELLYFGAGDWRLGVVRREGLDQFRAKAARIRAVAESHAPRKRNPKTLMLADAIQQGFVQIVQYHGTDPTGEVVVAQGVPGCEYRTSIVEDWRWRTNQMLADGGQAVFKERLRHTDGTARREAKAAETEEWLHTDGRDKYNRVVKDRKVFGSAGMTGGVDGAMKDLALAERRLVLPGEDTFDEVLAMVAEYQLNGED